MSGDTDPNVAKISANFAEFERYVKRAQENFAAHELEAAAVSVALAAHVATSTHCGIFWSPRLERLLNAIGRSIPDSAAADWQRTSTKGYANVLHVCSHLADTGGLTRMISRWVAADKCRTYSIALTQHRGAVPQHLSTAIAQSGGRIHRLNQRAGGLFEWVRELRKLARQYDVLILHIHCEDVIPLLAFAQPKSFPPILFLNHADHLFWLGPSISHVVINLRDAAKDLSVSRRGVAPERNLLVPTIVDQTTRSRSRNEAKQALGLDRSHVVLTSVARAPKYRTIDGVTYADLHVPLLLKYPHAELVVVGAGAPKDWARAIEATGGRIKPLPSQNDPRPYYEAADIYVDSFPFVSSTSMMEAAGYGLPLVTIFKAPDTAQIFGINHVGLVGTAMVAHSDTEYAELLAKLIVDEDFRVACGGAAQDAITRMHTPVGWLPTLEAVYTRSMELPPVDTARTLHADHLERPQFGEPDCRHEGMFKSEYPLSGHIKGYIGMLPARQHLAYWQELRRQGDFTSVWEASCHLFPEWLKRVLKDRIWLGS